MAADDPTPIGRRGGMRTFVIHVRPPSEGPSLVVAELSSEDDPAKAAFEMADRYRRVNWLGLVNMGLPLPDGHAVEIVTSVRGK